MDENEDMEDFDFNSFIGDQINPDTGDVSFIKRKPDSFTENPEPDNTVFNPEQEENDDIVPGEEFDFNTFLSQQFPINEHESIAEEGDEDLSFLRRQQLGAVQKYEGVNLFGDEGISKGEALLINTVPFVGGAVTRENVKRDKALESLRNGSVYEKFTKPFSDAEKKRGFRVDPYLKENTKRTLSGKEPLSPDETMYKVAKEGGIKDEVIESIKNEKLSGIKLADRLSKEAEKVLVSKYSKRKEAGEILEKDPANWLETMGMGALENSGYTGQYMLASRLPYKLGYLGLIGEGAATRYANLTNKQYGIDDDGSLIVIDNQDEGLKTMGKAVLGSTAEVGTEAVLNHLLKLGGKKLWEGWRGKKPFKGIKNTSAGAKVDKSIESISKKKKEIIHKLEQTPKGRFVIDTMNNFDDIRKMASVGSLAGEWHEEMVGSFVDNVIGLDVKSADYKGFSEELSDWVKNDLFSSKNNIDLLLQIAGTQVLLGTASGAKSSYNKRYGKIKYIDYKLDDDGNKIPETDADGNVLKDSKGNVIYKTTGIKESNHNRKSAIEFLSQFADRDKIEKLDNDNLLNLVRLVSSDSFNAETLTRWINDVSISKRQRDAYKSLLNTVDSFDGNDDSKEFVGTFSPNTKKVNVPVDRPVFEEVIDTAPDGSLVKTKTDKQIGTETVMEEQEQIDFVPAMSEKYGEIEEASDKSTGVTVIRFTDKSNVPKTKDSTFKTEGIDGKEVTINKPFMVVSKNGTKKFAINEQEAVDIAKEMSVQDQTLNHRRSKRLEYIQNKIQEKAPGGKFVFYDNARQYMEANPDAVKEGFRSDIPAMRNADGSVTFILDNIKTPFDVDQNIRHEEVLHGGLDRMFPDVEDKKKFLKGIYSEKEIKEIVDGWNQRRKEMGLEELSPDDPKTIEEIFVHTHDSMKASPNFFQKADLAIKRRLVEIKKSLGLKGDLKYNKGDIEALLDEMEKKTSSMEGGSVEHIEDTGTWGERNITHPDMSSDVIAPPVGKDFLPEDKSSKDLSNLTPEEKDAKYAEAFEKGDSYTARELVDEKAKESGYTIENKTEAGIGKESFKDKESVEKNMEDTGKVNLWGMSQGIDVTPGKDFETKGREHQAKTKDIKNVLAYNKVVNTMKKARDSKEENVKISMFQAVPKTDRGGTLRIMSGTVSPTKEYARDAGISRLGKGNYKIIENKIPIENVWWDGKNINEWTYDDGNNYFSGNTKNNMKRSDEFTKDEEGNLIPLSKRFDKRNKSPMFNDLTMKVNNDKYLESASKRLNGVREGVYVSNDEGVLDSILDGSKTMETRTRPTLRNVVGKRVALIETGRPSKVVGFADVDEEVWMPSEKFDSYYNEHKIGKNSKFYTKGKGKYGYKLSNVEKVEPFVSPKNMKSSNRSVSSFYNDNGDTKFNDPSFNEKDNSSLFIHPPTSQQKIKENRREVAEALGLDVKNFDEPPISMMEKFNEVKETTVKDISSVHDLMNSFKNNPRPPTTHDVAVMTTYTSQLQYDIEHTEHEAHLSDLKGNFVHAQNLRDMNEKNKKLLTEAFEAMNDAGREWGRTGRIMQAFYDIENDTFDGFRSHLEKKIGKKISGEDLEKAKEVFEKYKKLKAELDKLRENKMEEESKKELNKKIKGSLRDPKKHSDGKPRTREDIDREYEDAIEYFSSNSLNGNSIFDLPKLKKMMEALYRKHIQDGIDEGVDKTEESLVKDIHEDLDPYFEDISDNDIRQVLTGYGNIKVPDQSDVEKKLRDIRSQARVTQQLEDIANDLIPKKTGTLPDKPSQELREKEKERNSKLKELMERHPEWSLEHNADKLKSAIDSIRTRIENEIKDLLKAINTGVPLKNNKRSPVNYPDDVKKLKNDLDELRKIYDLKFRDDAKEYDKAVKIYEKVLTRRLNEWKARYEEAQKGNFNNKKPDKKPLESDLITELKDNIDDYKNRIKALKESMYPGGTPEEIARWTQRRIDSLNKREEKYRTILMNHDFGNIPKREKSKISQTVDSDPEVKKLTKRVEAAKKRVSDEVKAYNRRHAVGNIKIKGGSRLFDWFDVAIDLPRLAKTTFDLSAVLGQGAPITVSHPKEAKKAFIEQLKAFASENYTEELFDKMQEDPDFDDFIKSGGKIYNVDTLSSDSDIPEEFRGVSTKLKTLSGKEFSVADFKVLPGKGDWKHIFKASERAYATYLNVVSLNLYKLMKSDARFGESGPDSFQKEDIARFVNTSAGYGFKSKGGNGTWDKIARTLLWAPRLLVASIKQLTGADLVIAYRNGLTTERSSESRNASLKVLGKEFARQKLSQLAWAIIANTLVGNGDDWEKWKEFFNPTSTNFMSPRVHNISLNFLGPVRSLINFSARVISGTNYRNGKANKIGRIPTLGRFMRSKFSPNIGILWSILEGKEYSGDKYTPFSFLRDAFIPMSVEDTLDAMGENPLPLALLMLPLIVSGGTRNIFETDKFKDTWELITNKKNEIEELKKDKNNIDNIYKIRDIMSAYPLVSKYEKLKGMKAYKDIRKIEKQMETLKKNGREVPSFMEKDYKKKKDNMFNIMMNMEKFMRK